MATSMLLGVSRVRVMVVWTKRDGVGNAVRGLVALAPAAYGTGAEVPNATSRPEKTLTP
jgi:hypothetical protein